jgi:hypothetical protein
LARSLSDLAFGELRRQLGYKTSWRGGGLIVADRFFPSSRTCSALRGSESQAVAGRGYLHVRETRPGHRPGRERRKEPTRARRQWQRVNAWWSRGMRTPRGWPLGPPVRPSVMLGTRRYRRSPRSLRRGVRSRNPAPLKRVRPGPPSSNHWLRVGWLLMTTDLQRLLVDRDVSRAGSGSRSHGREAAPPHAPRWIGDPPSETAI